MSLAADHIMQLLQQYHITFKKRIGKGTFASILLGYDEHAKKAIVVKQIDTSSSSRYIRHHLPLELEVVEKLRHPNIVRVSQIIREEGTVLLLQEYAQGGDLLKRIKRDKALPETEAAHFFRQIIEALEYLARSSVVHRDIKCENVFLDACDNVKLGDFGFSRFLRGAEVSTTFCGSKSYIAPEIMSHTAYTGTSVDIWSSGIVLFTMITGLFPFNDRDRGKMYSRMMERRISWPRNHTASDAVRSLIRSILHPEPMKRASYAQMKSSAWLAHTPYCMRTSAFV